MFDDNDYNEEEENLDYNYDPTPTLPASSFKETLLKSATPPITRNQQEAEEDAIENEIDKLRIENKKTKSKTIVIKSGSISSNAAKEVDALSSSISSSLNSKRPVQHKNSFSNFKDETLLASSLKAANNFDKKLHDIENYSQIIENATLKMDACVKDMNIVYENFDNKLRSESSSLSTEDLNNRLANNVSSANNETKTELDTTQKGIYSAASLCWAILKNDTGSVSGNIFQRDVLKPNKHSRFKPISYRALLNI